MAAVISNGGGFYSTFAYLSEARRMGLKLLLPDINASALEYTGSGRELRIGLMQLKGVAEAFLERVVKERRRSSYTSLENFLVRVPGDVSQIKILIRAGCFDSLAEGMSRPQLIWKLLQLHSLHNCGSLPFRLPPPWVPQVDYSLAQKLRDEMETLGLLASSHPMSLYKRNLEKTPHVPAKRLQDFIGRRVVMAGWLITGKVVSTQKGEAMEFMTFEDSSALYETTFFPRSYRENGPLLNQREPFWLMGKVEEDHGAVMLNVEKVRPFSSDTETMSPSPPFPHFSILALDGLRGAER
jgi:error-prone DNA polymerase